MNVLVIYNNYGKYLVLRRKTGAMGDGKDTLLHAFVREVIFYIPLMFILDYFFNMNGLISSLVVGEFLGMIFAVILLKRWMRKKISPSI